MNPENYLSATERITARATDHITSIYGDAGHEITSMFRPQDVARIVAEEIAPEMMIAREIAELERDIAEIRLAQAMSHIRELEASH